MLITFDIFKKKNDNSRMLIMQCKEGEIPILFGQLNIANPSGARSERGRRHVN